VEPEAPTITWYSFTTDAAFPRHVVNAQCRMLLTQPSAIVLEVFFAVILLLGAAEGPGIAGLAPALLMGGVAALVYVLSNLQVRKVVPVGSVHRAALGPDTLFTESLLGSAAMPYGLFGRIRASDHVVLLQNVRAKQWVALPRAVFPGAVLDELRERVRVAEPSTGVEPPTDTRGGQPEGVTSSWTVDADYTKRVSRAYVAELIFSPARAAVLSLIVVGTSVGMAIATDATAGAGVVLVGVVVATFLVAFAFLASSLRRRVSKQIPAGSTFRVSVGAERLWIEGPGATGEMRYEMLRGVRLRGDIVLVRTAVRGQLLAMPAQLLPGGGLTELGNRIAAAQVAR
jgi:hypothetical protein